MSPEQPRLRPSTTQPITPADNSVAYDPAHVVLAAMLRAPQRELVPLIRSVFPGDDQSPDYRNHLVVVKRSVLELMNHITGSDTRATSLREPALPDRLTVCWQLLFSADQVVKALKPDDVPAEPDLPWVCATFAPLVGTPLAPSLASALLEGVRLGANGEFTKHYAVFLSAIKRLRQRPTARPVVLPTPLSPKTLSDEGVHRLAWWLIRSRRERYVEVPAATEQPYVYVHFEYLVKALSRELAWLCGDAAIHIIHARDIIEHEVNAWLRYSALDADDSRSDPGDGEPTLELARDIVRAFSETNRLTQKLVVADAQPRPQADAEIEEQLRQYSAENRALEERLRLLEAELASRSSLPADTHGPPTLAADGPSDLREFVRLIDAKYSLDTLKGIQLGNESPLTLRSFVSHVLYALTKKGLVSYPTEDDMLLSYEKSGLFECEDFQVAPGETLRVAVVRRGWAVQARDRLLPVRRARVTRRPEDSGDRE